MHKIHITHNVIITIYNEFTNFRAYYKYHPSRKKLWTKSFPKNLPVSTASTPAYPVCMEPHKLDYSLGYWVKQQNEHRYILPDPESPNGWCMPSSLRPEEINSCFVDKFKKSMTLIGDSHIRFTFYYMTNVTGGRELYRNVQHNITEQDRIFLWTTMCHNLVANLEEYLNKYYHRPVLNEDPAHLLILGIGSWDMDFNSTQVNENRNVVSHFFSCKIFRPFRRMSNTPPMAHRR